MPKNVNHNGHDYTIPIGSDPADIPTAFQTFVDSLPATAGAMSSLTDVDLTHSPPGVGDSLRWDPAQGKWIAGSPEARIPEWAGTTHYGQGATVYHLGRFWHANIQTTGVEPNIADGNVMVGFVPTRGGSARPTVVSVIDYRTPDGTAPHVPAPQFRGRYCLIYGDDTHVEVWETVPHVVGHTVTYEWGHIGSAGVHFNVWRHVALPPAALPPGFGYVWVYGPKGHTVPPVVGQDTWAPYALGDFLESLADVDIVAAVPGNTLTLDPDGRWRGHVPASGLPTVLDPSMVGNVLGVRPDLTAGWVAAVPGPAGPPGSSVTVGAVVATVGDLPAAAGHNLEVHFVSGTGDLFISDGVAWHNMGHVAGPPGQSVTVVEMTRSQYDALTVKDPMTLYVVTGP